MGAGVKNIILRNAELQKVSHKGTSTFGSPDELLPENIIFL